MSPCPCLHRWVRHLITCISKYQSPGRTPSAQEEGRFLTGVGRGDWVSEPLLSLEPQLLFCTPDCYSETEAEDHDEETGSRSASVSRGPLCDRRVGVSRWTRGSDWCPPLLLPTLSPAQRRLGVHLMETHRLQPPQRSAAQGPPWLP